MRRRPQNSTNTGSDVDYEGALALMSGWTGVDLSQYGPGQELRAMETNSNQSALESFTLSDPNRHWTIGR